MHVVLELPHQVLAAAPERLDAAPGAGGGHLLARERAAPPRVEHLELGEHAALDVRREVAADRLDLGQLGHRGEASGHGRRRSPAHGMRPCPAMSLLDRFRLDGKVAIVTGASSGLGVAFAEGLAEAGADVVISARGAWSASRTRARAVEALGRRCVAVRGDVTVVEDCDRVVAEAMEAFGRVDVLVNNAGLGTAVPAARETPEQFRSVVDINLNGSYWMAQACGRVMQPGSSIVNIGSVLGSTTAGAAAGRLQREQGGDHRAHARPRPAVDGPQGHPRQRARARLLPLRDDRRVPRGLPREDDRCAVPGRPARRPGRAHLRG